MRLKFITLLIFAFFATQTSNAQNTTMAKAFYTKAQQAYADKDYESVISLLEKTKENLNGKTNPDITYLEAKSSYEHDLNINKTKELMNLFMKTADPSDARVKEIAGLLADIEVSDNYFGTGDKKKVVGYDSKGNKYVDYYDTPYAEPENAYSAKRIKKEWYLKRYNFKLSDTYFFYNDFNSQNYGEIFYHEFYNENGTLNWIEYYQNNKKKLRYSYNDNKTTIYDLGGNPILSYIVKKHDFYKTTNSDYLYLCMYNGSEENCFDISSFKITLSNYQKNIISTHPFEVDNAKFREDLPKLSKLHYYGFIKEVDFGLNRKKYNSKLFISEDCSIISQMLFKNGKVVNSQIFDYKLGKWVFK